jgi:hypothetical protein
MLVAPDEFNVVVGDAFVVISNGAAVHDTPAFAVESALRY